MGANNDENQWWDFYVINVDLSYFLGKFLCYFAYTLFLRYFLRYFENPTNIPINYSHLML